MDGIIKLREHYGMSWLSEAEVMRSKNGQDPFAPKEGLTEFDLRILKPHEVRLGIPVISRFDLRVVADQLRRLATILDVESRRNDVEERASLFRVLCEVNMSNRVIRDHYKEVWTRLNLPQPKRGGRPRADREI